MDLDVRYGSHVPIPAEEQGCSFSPGCSSDATGDRDRPLAVPRMVNLVLTKETPP